MTYPQCPQIKSLPPVPDIPLSVWRIDRFNVVIGPIGIIGMVAICSPDIRHLGTSIPRKYNSINPVAPDVSLLPRATCGSETEHDEDGWRRERLQGAVDPPLVAPRLLGRRRRGQGRPCRSVPSGDRLFELDFGGEAVAITPDRQHRQFAAALPVSHRAVLRRKASIDLDPVPFRGMSDVIEQQIVLLGPEERHRVEALPRPEHIAGSRLALPFGDNPVLDARRRRRG